VCVLLCFVLPVTFKQVSTGFPKFSNPYGSKRESLSLKRVDRNTIQSGDPNILSLISFVSCHSCPFTHVFALIHGWSGEDLRETSIHQKIVSCILRFQSIWVGISGDNPSFRVHKREKTHALYAYQMLSALSCTHVGPFNHVLSLMSIHLIFPPMSIHSCPFTDDNWEMIHLFANN